MLPLLRCADKNTPLYSNFHHPVSSNGYYVNSDIYYKLLERKEPSLHIIDLVHCTYLIRKDVLNKISYNDDTQNHEYVIFSRNLRKSEIPQILDTRKIYGYLTLNENVDVCKEAMMSLV